MKLGKYGKTRMRAMKNSAEKKLNIDKKNLIKSFTILCFALICILSINTSVSVAQKSGWVKKSGKTYYYHPNSGQKVKGLKKISGKYYYLNKKGVLYKKGWKTIKGAKYYFAKKTGKAATGSVKLGSKRYLFSAKGKLYGSGIKAYKGKYYYTKKGIVQTGWQKIDGNKFYFNGKGVMKKNCWINNTYYVGDNGIMQKNCWIGKYYYVGSDGKKLKNCWKNEKYLGADGKWIKGYTEDESNNNTTDTRTFTFYEAYSIAVFNEINNYRVSQGKEPFKYGENRHLKGAKIRAAYNVYHIDFDIPGSDTFTLANHAGVGIGIGGVSLYPEKVLNGKKSFETVEDYAKYTVQGWIDSPLHRGNLLSNFCDTCAVAVVSNDINHDTSVIAALGRNDDVQVSDIEFEDWTGVPPAEWNMLLNLPTTK